MLHRNARLTVHGRRLVCRRVLELHESISRVARDMGVSRQTVAKWVRRFLESGEAGLFDRSSRPGAIRERVPAKTVRAIVRTRQRERIGAHRISWKLGVSRSTVCLVLRRVGLARIRDLEPATIRGVRYEWPCPGDLVHVDTKRLSRIGEGGGKRIHGWTHEHEHKGIGWNFVHVAIDDATRLAYAEELPDERAATATAFLERALAFYSAHGFEVKRVISDNAPCYYAQVFRRALEDRGIKVLKTAPYHPQTNGKAEALVKVLANQWAYAVPYMSTARRIEALGRFLNRYNHFRPHGGLNGATPIERLSAVNNLCVRYT